MLALDGTWELLRAIGKRTVRGLAAVEPGRVNRRAQRNAADAAAQASARCREAEEAGRWLSFPPSGSVRQVAGSEP